MSGGDVVPVVASGIARTLALAGIEMLPGCAWHERKNSPYSIVQYLDSRRLIHIYMA